MAIDNIEIMASYTEVDQKLLQRTGLKGEEVHAFQRDSVYAVILTATGEGNEGKEYKGTCVSSIEGAIANATNNGSLAYDENRVNVSVKRIAEVPYFTIPLTVRSLNEDKLRKNLFDAIGELRSTYGRRLDSNPESVTYKVLKIKGVDYEHDQKIPKGNIPKTKIAAEKTSFTSITEAAAVETRSKQVKCTVYEQTADLKVYGQPEKSLQVKDGISKPLVATGGVPTIITSRKSGKGKEYVSTRQYAPRAGSTSAAEPVYFQSANPLM